MDESVEPIIAIGAVVVDPVGYQSVTDCFDAIAGRYCPSIRGCSVDCSSQAGIAHTHFLLSRGS